MYPFVDLYNIASPSIDSLIEQTMFSLLSPMFDVSAAFAHGNTTLSSSSSRDSSIVSTWNNQKVRVTPKSAPGPVRNKRQRLDFCKVCQKNITEEGKRNQGPRRHILQHHLCRPIFFCSLCPATSNYDKAHIRTHMQRIHKGIEGDVIEVEKKIFAMEEERWFKRCFGECAESRSNFIIKEQTMKPELQAKEDVKNNFIGELHVKEEPGVKVEEIDVDDASSVPSTPILFSIDRILKGRTRNF